MKKNRYNLCKHLTQKKIIYTIEKYCVLKTVLYKVLSFDFILVSWLKTIKEKQRWQTKQIYLVYGKEFNAIEKRYLFEMILWFYSGIIIKTRKINLSPRIAYKTLSNMKRIRQNLSYWSACMIKFNNELLHRLGR